ncbi:reverse transcriptase domain-containing protein [Tanacetum coccineum]
MSVYFISRDLRGFEVSYSTMEKLVMALVNATKRLRRYFQVHPIVVITDQPIKQILSKLEIAGRMQKWSVELGEHDISHKQRTSIQGQILVDFIVEKPEEEVKMKEASAEEKLPEPWTLFTDGSSCVDGSGAGLILTNPEGAKFTSKEMEIQNLQANVDSRLVANQVNGSFEAKEQSMAQNLEKTKALIEIFKKFSIKQLPQSENKKADALSKIGSTSFPHLAKTSWWKW